MKHLETIFETHVTRVRTRQTENAPYSWLFSSPLRHPFIPDYLTLSTYGKTKWQSVLNQTLCLTAPYLWHHFVLPKVRHRTLQHLDTFILSKLPTSTQKHQFVDTLDQLLKRPLAIFRFFSFTDLYAFISEASQHFLTQYGPTLDLYHKEKQAQNKHLLSLYANLKSALWAREDIFELLTYLIVRANWMDVTYPYFKDIPSSLLAEVNELLDADHKSIWAQRTHNPFFHLSRFKTVVSQAKTILYELDNAGEIIIDFLFITHLLDSGHTLILVAKQHPTLNDVTLTEVAELLQHPALSHLLKFNQTGQLQLIHNGANMPGKLVSNVPNDYKKAYQASDLVILKGQGNFQTLPIHYPYAKPHVYMMGIRSPIIRRCLACVLPRHRLPKLGSPFLYVSGVS